MLLLNLVIKKKGSDVIDAYMSRKTDEEAAKAFLDKAIAQNGLPKKIVTYESDGKIL
jgi:transposase-like protein